MSHIKYTRENYREFLNHCKNTPRLKGDSYTLSSEDNSYWSGTDSFEEALDLGYNGWDAGLKQLALEDGIAVTGGIDYMPNVCGSVVNMGAYLMGMPDCMFEVTEKREYNLDPLTIYVPLNMACGVNLKKSMGFCMNVIKIVNEYQSKFNVRLIGQMDLDHPKGRMVNEIVIKDFDSRFVLNNIAFAFHTSFFRRIWTKYLETTDYCASGYGSNVYQTKEFAARIKNEIKGTEKAILIPMIQDTDSSGNFAEDKIVKWNF